MIVGGTNQFGSYILHCCCFFGAISAFFFAPKIIHSSVAIEQVSRKWHNKRLRADFVDSRLWWHLRITPTWLGNNRMCDATWL